jgi:ribosomal protein S18 acetylase RimI-like enzyme
MTDVHFYRLGQAMTQIRTLRREDDFLTLIADLIALSRDFFREYQAHHQDFFAVDRLCDSDIVDYFSNAIDSDDCEAYVAVVDGQVVGYITASIRERPIFSPKKMGAISGLMVHRDYRRRGIATQLLAQARAFFEQKGVRYFTVYTAVENRGAIAFYECSGLVPLHTNMIGEVANPPEVMVSSDD